MFVCQVGFKKLEEGSYIYNFCRSPDCFQIGWPMRLDHNFFCVQPSSKPKAKKTPVSHNTVEERMNREVNEDEELGVNYVY